MSCYFMAQLSDSVINFFNEKEAFCSLNSWNTVRTFVTAVQLYQFKESLKDIKNMKYYLLPNESEIQS